MRYGLEKVLILLYLDWNWLLTSHRTQITTTIVINNIYIFLLKYYVYICFMVLCSPSNTLVGMFFFPFFSITRQKSWKLRMLKYQQCKLFSSRYALMLKYVVWKSILLQCRNFLSCPLHESRVIMKTKRKWLEQKGLQHCLRNKEITTWCPWKKTEREKESLFLFSPGVNSGRDALCSAREIRSLLSLRGQINRKFWEK